jgi:hypothetical protein
LLQRITLNAGTPGTLWHVLEMDGVSQNISMVNRIEFEPLSPDYWTLALLDKGWKEFSFLLRGLKK